MKWNTGEELLKVTFEVWVLRSSIGLPVSHCCFARQKLPNVLELP